jgi:hypothetical protein
LPDFPEEFARSLGLTGDPLVVSAWAMLVVLAEDALAAVPTASSEFSASWFIQGAAQIVLDVNSGVHYCNWVASRNQEISRATHRVRMWLPKLLVGDWSHYAYKSVGFLDEPSYAIGYMMYPLVKLLSDSFPMAHKLSSFIDLLGMPTHLYPSGTSPLKYASLSLCEYRGCTSALLSVTFPVDALMRSTDAFENNFGDRRYYSSGVFSSELLREVLCFREGGTLLPRQKLRVREMSIETRCSRICELVRASSEGGREGVRDLVSEALDRADEVLYAGLGSYFE